MGFLERILTELFGTVEDEENKFSRPIGALDYVELLDVEDESRFPGPETIDLDSRDAPSGWRCTKNDTHFGIHYREKGLFKESEEVRIELIPSAGAQCYRLEPGSDVRHQMINGPATIPQGVAVAKLYMAYGITPPACSVRVPKEQGVGFTKANIGHYIRVMKQTDMHPLKQHAEYCLKIGDPETDLNKYLRGETYKDPYNAHRRNV